ncbi:uncharacterized protein LOC128964270 [Oppia nitens]|uniref:uncharacterized protein LOC128964270 n=1 Tax=Oppia nitens TaxID=1686743 RepID=UPI0023D98F9B|nr:uncharacterized protein LOC128964270 [Oppia nitens]
MSTSSDSYSSGDEKDDSGSSDFGKDSISTNSIQHLKTDSESDTFSTTSDSSLDIKANYRPEVRSKPELPMKPNMGKINAQTITTTTPMAPVLQIPSAKQSVLPMTLFVNNTNPVEEQEEEMNVNSIQKINDTFTNEEMFKTDDNCVTQIICDPDYQDINESNEEMNGMDGMYSSLSESIDNNYLVDNKEEESISPEAHDKHRVIKLAELAQELEQCRQVKRPAPQPPNSSSPEISDDSIESDYKSTATESKLTIFNNKSETTKQQQLVSSSALNTSSSTPMKQRFSSIRKLLHKKIDKAISDKNKVTISEPTLSTAPDTSSDRKAWKQSEFDRTTIKILHPSDMTTNIQVKQYTTNEQSSEQPPEAPPRAPKVNRPSVPARRRNKSVPNTGLLAHQREPPPPVPVVLHHKTLEKSSSLPIHTNITITANNITNTSIHQKAPIAETTVQNSLNEAYNQLAKSNLSNLLAIKLKIESKCSQQLYKWTDFEVTTALTLGSVKVYKDCIVSDTRKFVNLVVLSDCYCAPIVNQFRVHNELVLVLDYKWTQFCLLDSMSAKTFEQKQINSLILQLYSILEYFESHRYNQLPENIVNTIIIGASNDDILLIIPLNNDSTDSNIGSQITLHQFLSQMLAKLLPNSLFASVGHDLTQPSIQINQSKTIVQMIAFYIPVHEMCNTSNDADTDRQINYWFDINRSKFINQFCCLTDTNVLTQLDYIYLNFLCNHSIDMIRNVLPLMNSFTNN